MRKLVCMTLATVSMHSVQVMAMKPAWSQGNAGSRANGPILTVPSGDFLNSFRDKLFARLDQDQINQGKTCIHGLSESLTIFGNATVTPESIAAIRDDYFNKLDVFVENQHGKHLGNKPHWIKGRVAGIAKAVFYELATPIERSDRPGMTGSTPSSSSLPSSSSSSSSSSAPAAKAPKSDALMSLGENTIFKAFDFNYAGYSESEIHQLAFSENCCAFSKLALYVLETPHLSMIFHNDLHAIVRAINSAVNGLGSNYTGTLTVHQLLSDFKR